MDTVQRFLFEDLDIRGALVRLGPAWESMHGRRDYARPVRDLLGELAAVSTLIASNLKTPARLTFQLQGHGHGPISMLVMDCDEQLRIRGMARSELVPESGGGHSPHPSLPPAGQDIIGRVGHLLGDGQLMLTLQPEKGSPYQSVVPLKGDTLAQMFEHYLTQSEQQPARFWLSANADTACGLFLQKLPNADALDPDGWDRIEQLAATVRPEELLLPAETLLARLFGAETIRLFPTRTVTWNCPRNDEKVRNMLLSLGREEVEAMLADADMIAIEDEICGHQYSYGPELLDELFPPAGRILH